MLRGLLFLGVLFTGLKYAYSDVAFIPGTGMATLCPYPNGQFADGAYEPEDEETRLKRLTRRANHQADVYEQRADEIRAQLDELKLRIVARFTPQASPYVSSYLAGRAYNGVPCGAGPYVPPPPKGGPPPAAPAAPLPKVEDPRPRRAPVDQRDVRYDVTENAGRKPAGDGEDPEKAAPGATVELNPSAGICNTHPGLERRCSPIVVSRGGGPVSPFCQDGVDHFPDYFAPTESRLDPSICTEQVYGIQNENPNTIDGCVSALEQYGLKARRLEAMLARAHRSRVRAEGIEDDLDRLEDDALDDDDDRSEAGIPCDRCRRSREGRLGLNIRVTLGRTRRGIRPRPFPRYQPYNRSAALPGYFGYSPNGMYGSVPGDLRGFGCNDMGNTANLFNNPNMYGPPPRPNYVVGRPWPSYANGGPLVRPLLVQPNNNGRGGNAPAIIGPLGNQPGLINSSLLGNQLNTLGGNLNYLNGGSPPSVIQIGNGYTTVLGGAGGAVGGAPNAIPINSVPNAIPVNTLPNAFPINQPGAIPVNNTGTGTPPRAIPLGI